MGSRTGKSVPGVKGSVGPATNLALFDVKAKHEDHTDASKNGLAGIVKEGEPPHPVAY